VVGAVAKLGNRIKELLGFTKEEVQVEEEKMDLEKRRKAAEYAVKKYKIEIPKNNENE
jgi:hypothetical protein